MRAASPLRALLLLLATAALASACATPVDVAWDRRHDYAGDRTWAFEPEAVPRVFAPHGNPARLEKRVARLIERELFARGIERTHGPADLLVRYRLSVRRFAKAVDVPVAAMTVEKPFAPGPKWVIEGASTRETRLFEDVHLAISVAQAPGETLWHASLSRRQEAQDEPPLEELVETLLEEYPRGTPATDASR